MHFFKSIVGSKSTYISFLGTLLFFISCHEKNVPADPESPEENNQYLLKDSLVNEVSKMEIINNVSSLEPSLAGFAKAVVYYNVKTFKLTYKTKNSDGSDIIASGALILPVTRDTLPVISVQHGTITSDSEAPSNYGINSESSSLGLLFGSTGYIVAYPDYIGYGASKNYPHPYEHRETLASASLDMLRATKEFIKSHPEINWRGYNSKEEWKGNLYVAGYSEGGYATMSLQKKIEEEASSEFNLRASSCGAGAYDKTAFMKEVINNTTHGISGYNKLYLWVMLTYDRIYKLNKPASYYFKEPFAGQIDAAGTGFPIDQSFNTILTDSFKKALNDGTDKNFINAVADNDVYNWKPRTPTRLYHGNADPLVFYFNSVNAVAAMKKLGAGNVELITVPNGTHSSSIAPFLLGTYIFFTETK